MKIETYREIEDSLQEAKELIKKCLKKKSEINTDEKYQKTWFENLDKIYQGIIANQMEMIFTLKIDD